MAMDGDQMGAEIMTAILSPAATPESQAASLAMWKKIAGAIVKHIQDNAEVPAGIAVSTSGGAGSTSGPGQVQ
jgi:hypothetical protein